MAYRRKRRSKGTWFPTFGQRAGSETDNNNVSGQSFDLDLDGQGGAVVTVIKDLTYDFPHEPDDQQPDHSLEDIIGNEYILQRIVGKCFAQYDRGADNDFSFKALVGLGFFVARADADGSGPIGSATQTAAEINQNYSPLTTETAREPWIWRRTWVLADEPGLYQQTYPKSTAGYGSLYDGPHIDSKVKRRIGQDDRLFAAVSACTYPFVETSEDDHFGTVYAFVDYRIFGSLRKAKNRSAF